MTKLSAVAIALVAFGIPFGAQAAFDGSKPFLCAITEAIECDDDGNCIRGGADDVNIPPFIRVDVPGKTLIEHWGERSTAIVSHTRSNGQLILQGIQERAWSVSISEETGQLSATASAPGAGFVLFGACTDY